MLIQIRSALLQKLRSLLLVYLLYVKRDRKSKLVCCLQVRYINTSIFHLHLIDIELFVMGEYYFEVRLTEM